MTDPYRQPDLRELTPLERVYRDAEWGPPEMRPSGGRVAFVPEALWVELKDWLRCRYKHGYSDGWIAVDDLTVYIRPSMTSPSLPMRRWYHRILESLRANSSIGGSGGSGQLTVSLVKYDPLVPTDPVDLHE